MQNLEELLKTILEEKGKDTEEFNIDTCSDKRFLHELEKIYDSEEKHAPHLRAVYKISPIIASYLWSIRVEQNNLYKQVAISRLFGK